ncbi:hypothetical protein AAMO2058_001754400 [Amorphochlora amoebiformis]
MLRLLIQFLSLSLSCAKLRSTSKFKSFFNLLSAMATYSMDKMKTRGGGREIDRYRRFCRKCERRVQRDEGGRGISDFVINSELEKIGKAVAQAKNVAILTGFPCNIDHDIPQETDGPPGAVAIARACQALGIQVSIYTDDVNYAVVQAAAKGENYSIDVQSFPPAIKWGSIEEKRIRDILATVDHVISIERSGPGIDGRYYTMEARDMTPLLAPLERLVEEARRESILTTGIGDGGNEIGMGKVREQIINSNVKFAEKIACRIPTDFLLTCSVSNWGGYAVALAIGAAGAIEGRNSNRMAMVPTPEEEIELIKRMVQAGARTQ